ncbi:MAG: TetR/AcrR family transcriptional regulator [Actinobacteria bacterium]|nr:TetR/AcrR family transcriptional regulator [Actinomycetota bacterium]
MTPRRYRMGARAEAVAQTRQRIVDAATELHADRGVLATSWEDIAERADVSQATVYRHFPSLVELIPACAESVFDVAQVPTIEQASKMFAACETARCRFEQLVRDSCHCFDAGEAWLDAARRERRLIAAIDEVVTRQEEALAVLVRACLGGDTVRPRSLQLLCVLCDFPFWKQLVDRGMAKRTAEATIVALVNTVLDEEGVQ